MSKDFPGHYIREWRQMAQLTQVELAKMVEMSPSNLNQIESGKTGYTQATLERLAAALRLGPGTLLSVHPQNHFDEDQQESPFMMEVTNVLQTMKPITRVLAIELLRAALKQEGLSDSYNAPGVMNLMRGEINKRYSLLGRG